MSYPPEKAGVPGSAIPPNRQTSYASNLSADAVPDEDPSETSKLLTERLQAWKHACGYLENYVAATEKVHKAQSKEYEKVLKTVSDPLREAHHFEQQLGGVAGFFENVRSNTQGIANSHVETEKALKGSVLPILERLHSEVKSKTRELTSGAAKGSKAVDKARVATQKHIELLGQYTASHDAAGGKIEPSNDPYILHRGVFHRLNKQIIEENNNRQDLLAVQNNFAQFEAHVIQTLQQAIMSFNQFVGGQAERTRAMYADMTSNLQNVPPDFEWKGFVSRNDHILVDPSQPPRELGNISFPNQNHNATQPLIQGSLEKKGKVLKTYSTGFFVVTPAKYLHEFKSDDDFRKDPSPQLSLYLPDCIIGGINGQKFNLKGKDTSKGKVGNALAMTHEMAFKAHTPADAEKWMEAIQFAVGHGPGAHYASGSETSSPIEKQQQQQQQQQQHPPPVQTQGLQQEGNITSPQSAGTQFATPQSATSAHGPTANELPIRESKSQGVGVYDAGAQNGTKSGVTGAPGQY
ncbi:PH domain-containing protein [Xylona heveae TC161]|uniref:PH domain-containing protein n=1 Tax=Xylona heveae (strain CBS 132557 / TC161) TaxID=1328760 RepID=A0A165FLI6_XYLHT|nr:PH domain-containing protein [Xylona heveae TC161]KZF21119.1 PH domain-containing protein [Xylona heveae TC161]